MSIPPLARGIARQVIKASACDPARANVFILYPLSTDVGPPVPDGTDGRNYQTAPAGTTDGKTTGEKSDPLLMEKPLPVFYCRDQPVPGAGISSARSTASIGPQANQNADGIQTDSAETS